MTLLFDGPCCMIRRPVPPVPVNRKLTDRDAAEIRRRHRMGERVSDLARMYDISHRAAYNVVSGLTYTRDAEQRIAA